MIGLAADENFRGAIVQGLRRRRPDVDIVYVQVYVQHAGLTGADDPAILAWAAEHSRVLLSHDRKTLIGFAYNRIRAGLPMPGLCVVDSKIPIGAAIADIELLLEAYADEDWRDRVVFVPI